VNSKTKYLETSSVRYLAKHLDDPLIKAECFTSLLTLLELITELKHDFDIRKNCVKKLMENISIDWQFPETIMSDAFPLIKSQEFRTWDFQLLCALLTQTNSYDEFISEAEKLNLTHNLNYFVETDAYHANNFVKASLNVIRETTQLLKKEEGSRSIPFDEPLVIDKRSDFYKVHEDYLEFNEGWTLQSLSEMYAQQLKREDPEKAAEELYNCYNGKVEYYIKAFSYYGISKIAQGNESNINDRLDLEHFLYLRNNPDIKIVSCDKLIQRICKVFWPEKWIHPKELVPDNMQQ
jgi:hypothetical protein